MNYIAEYVAWLDTVARTNATHGGHDVALEPHGPALVQPEVLPCPVRPPKKAQLPFKTKQHESRRREDTKKRRGWGLSHECEGCEDYFLGK